MAQITTRKRGKTWEYSFEIASIDGKRKRKSKGGFRTKAECLASGTQAKAEYDNGGHLIDNTNLSYSDWLDTWFKSQMDTMRLSTQTTYGIVVDKLKLAIGHYKISSITPLTLNNYFDDLKSDYTTGYIRFIKKVVNSSLSYAVDMNVIKTNPCDRIRIKSKDEDKFKDVSVISKDEFDTLINHLHSKYFEIPLYIGWYTGMRLGEVIALHWSDIDFENKIIKVTKTESQVAGKVVVSPPKTKKGVRDVLIGDTLINILKDWKALQLIQADKLKITPTDKVCTRKSLVPLKPINVKQQCTTLSKLTGIPFHFHALRHTHATLLIKNGVSLKEVQVRLGHQSIQTTLDVYAHLQPKDCKDSVNVFENL